MAGAHETVVLQTSNPRAGVTDSVAAGLASAAAPRLPAVIVHPLRLRASSKISGERIRGHRDAAALDVEPGFKERSPGCRELDTSVPAEGQRMTPSLTRSDSIHLWISQRIPVAWGCGATTLAEPNAAGRTGATPDNHVRPETSNMPQRVRFSRPSDRPRAAESGSASSNALISPSLSALKSFERQEVAVPRRL